MISKHFSLKKQAGKSWYEKTTLEYTYKENSKATIPLMLKSKMAASRGLATILDFNIPRNQS